MPLDRRALREMLDHKAKLVHKVPKVLKALLVQLVILALQEHKVNKDPKEQLVHKELLVRREPPVRQEAQEPQDHRVLKDTRAKLAWDS